MPVLNAGMHPPSGLLRHDSLMKCISSKLLHLLPHEVIDGTQRFYSLVNGVKKPAVIVYNGYVSNIHNILFSSSDGQSVYSSTSCIHLACYSSIWFHHVCI